MKKIFILLGLISTAALGAYSVGGKQVISIPGGTTFSPAAEQCIDWGAATAVHTKYTQDGTTGQTSTDGFDVGLTSATIAELRNYENTAMTFYTNNTEAMRILSTNEVLIGRSTDATNAILRASKAYTDPTGTTYNVVLDPTFSATTGSNAQAVAGLDVTPSIGASNTQNWTSGAGFTGIRIDPTGAVGGTGTITNFHGIFQQMSNSGGVVITNYRGNRVSNPGTPGSVTNFYGMTVDELTPGSTSNGELVLGGTTTVAGNWGIYNQSAYNNYIKSNTGFNNTAPAALIDALAGGVTALSSDQIKLTSQRAAIVSGNMVGGIAFRSNDTNITAPGTDVAHIEALAANTHTASDLTTRLAFSTTNVLTETEKMTIRGTGLVGIGLSAPTNLLHLDGGTATATYNQFTENATTGQTATDGFLVGTDASANAILNQQEALPLIMYTSGTERARIEATGSIVVGTTVGFGALGVQGFSGATNALFGLRNSFGSDRLVFQNNGTSNQNLGSMSSFNVNTQNAITFDAASSGTTTSAQNTVVWNHTVGSGNNRILIVGVSLHETDGSGNDTVGTVTYGAASLTNLSAATATRTGARVEVWYLLNPASGTDTITVTLAASAVDRVVGGSYSFSNVSQTTPFGTPSTTTGSAQSASLTPASAIGDLVIDVLSKNASAEAVSAGAGQSSKWNATTVAGGDSSTQRHIGAGSTISATDITTPVSWSWTTNNRAFAYAAVALKPTYSSAFTISASGSVVLPSTITAGGTVGAQTINKTTGTVNFAAAASSLTVTNSLVTTSSIIQAIARTNDATCSVKNVVPATGTFTINMTAACTAETSVGFLVTN